MRDSCLIDAFLRESGVHPCILGISVLERPISLKIQYHSIRFGITLTYIPALCAVVTLCDIVDALSVSSKKKDFESFCVALAVQ